MNEIIARYRHCLNGVGCDTQLPAKYSAAPFMDWLLGEVSSLEGHMTLGRDFAVVTAFKAVCARLSETSCDQGFFYRAIFTEIFEISFLSIGSDKI